jgi:hypothetical protein
VPHAPPTSFSRHMYQIQRFYGERSVAPSPTPKLEDHSLSAVRDYLFNIFAATVHICRPSPASATWGRAMSWWQGTQHVPLQVQIILNFKCPWFRNVREANTRPYDIYDWERCLKYDPS